MNKNVRDGWASLLADAQEARADAFDFAISAVEAVLDATTGPEVKAKLEAGIQMMDLDRQQLRKEAGALRESQKENAEQSSVRPLRTG